MIYHTRGEHMYTNHYITDAVFVTLTPFSKTTKQLYRILQLLFSV